MKKILVVLILIQLVSFAELRHNYRGGGEGPDGGGPGDSGDSEEERGKPIPTAKEQFGVEDPFYECEIRHKSDRSKFKHFSTWPQEINLSELGSSPLLKVLDLHSKQTVLDANSPKQMTVIGENGKNGFKIKLKNKNGDVQDFVELPKGCSAKVAIPNSDYKVDCHPNPLGHLYAKEFLSFRKAIAKATSPSPIMDALVKSHDTRYMGFGFMLLAHERLGKEVGSNNINKEEYFNALKAVTKDFKKLIEKSPVALKEEKLRFADEVLKEVETQGSLKDGKAPFSPFSK